MWKARQTWVKDRDDRNQQIREAPDVWARGTCGNMSTEPGEALWLTDLVHRAPPSFYPKFGTAKKERGRLAGFLESSRNPLVPIYCASDLLRHSFRRTVLSLQLLWTHRAMYQDDICRFGYTLFRIMLQKTTMTVDKPLHPS